jgi:parvulin-like peptidyl-prolyl isomerase
MGCETGARALGKAALLFVGLGMAAAVFSGCGAKPIASVNGKALSEQEFHHLCETATENPQGTTVGMQVLAEWILNSLLADEAKRLNVYPTEKDLQARIDSVRRQRAYVGQDLDAALRDQGMTLDAFKERLLVSMVRDNVLLRGVSVTDDEVRKVFEAQKQRLVQPERVRISQITSDSEEKIKQAHSNATSNANFALVAQTYSKDQFGPTGGKVPADIPAKIPAGGPVAQQAVDAAFKLKPGQISDPIKVGQTWVIVKLEEKLPGKTPKPEDFQEEFRSQLRQRKAQSSPQAQENQKSFMQASQKAQIIINPPQYKPLLERIQAGGGGGAPGGPASPAAPPAAPRG